MLNRMPALAHRPPRRLAPRWLAALAAALLLGVAPLPAETSGAPEEGRPQAPSAAPEGGATSHGVYAHTLKHQPAHEALAQIRRLLSPQGTVEVQPGGNTLVIRDRRAVLDRVIPVLTEFDHPPQDLRFDIRIVRAAPLRSVISPPIQSSEDSGLPEEILRRLRNLLRYDDYRVLAKAEMTSREGEDVTYALGRSYSVSFRPGTVIADPTGERLRLAGFRIQKHVENPPTRGLGSNLRTSSTAPSTCMSTDPSAWSWHRASRARRHWWWRSPAAGRATDAEP